MSAWAASQPLVPSKCPNPAASDPTAPLSLFITEKVPIEQAKQFLQTAVYCPSACYDLTAVLQLEGGIIADGGFRVTITPYNKCRSPSDAQKRGCSSGMFEPQISIQTIDNASSLKGWTMPQRTINKSRCDDTVIYNSVSQFLVDGLGQVQKNQQAGLAAMNQALNNLQTGVDQRPAAPQGGAAAGAGAPGGGPTFAAGTPETLSPKAPALGGGWNPLSGAPDTPGGNAGSSGGASSPSGGAADPIKQTVQPHLSSKSGGESATGDQSQSGGGQQPQGAGAPQGSGAVAGNPSGGDLNKIFQTQSNPQQGAQIQQPPAQGGQSGTQSSTQTGSANPSGGSTYNALTPPSAVKSESSSGGGLFSGGGITSILGSLLGPLFSLFGGSHSSSSSPPPPQPPLPPPLATLSALPSSVTRGQSITLTWTSSGVSEVSPCSLNQDGQQIAQGNTGSTTVQTSATSPNLIIFALQCQGQNGGSLQQSASVTVQ